MFGEVSLAGEIRRVAQAKLRAQEAARVGFRTAIDTSAGTVSDALREALMPGGAGRGPESGPPTAELAE